jgi:hypothetical protein
MLLVYYFTPEGYSSAVEVGLNLNFAATVVLRRSERLAAEEQPGPDIEASGQRLLEAEIWRLRSEFLLLQGSADLEVERGFAVPWEIANPQGARSWELRSANSLAQFLEHRGRGVEAKSVLEPVHAAMSEGWNTQDYKRALETLNTLS